jgi:hypothetical protein
MHVSIEYWNPLWNRGAALVTHAFVVRVFCITAVLCQCHEEHQRRICDHGRSCRACPASFVGSFFTHPKILTLSCRFLALHRARCSFYAFTIHGEGNPA